MKYRILVAEDDYAHRETLRRHLQSVAEEVCAVESAEQALNVVASFDPTMVLTDVRMGGMSGIELLERLKEVRPETPVVVMTAYGDTQSAIDAMKKGAFDFVLKPLDIDQLDAVVGRCLSEVASRPTQLASGGGAGQDQLVGRDPRMIEIYKIIGAITDTSTPVLIRGETGTGKELIARLIHENSSRAGAPFVPINCTAVPENLLESELFGHMRGSFTGAVSDRKGRFELAGDGTVFLDEIGDTTPAFQAKLLRVLQEHEFYPVGGEKPRQTKARTIAATHRPVEELIGQGHFREDLYFRLRVVEINIPPLRERRGDIPLLAYHFANRMSDELGRQILISDEVMATLLTYDWPGNVRELENAITRAAVLCRGSMIRVEHLSLGQPAAALPELTGEESLEDVERVHVQRVLAELGGNKSRAAERLKISRPRLDRIIQRHRLVV